MYTNTNDHTHYAYSAERYNGGGHVPLPAMVVAPDALTSVHLRQPPIAPSGNYGSLSPLKWEIGCSGCEYSNSSAPGYGVNSFQRSIRSQKKREGYCPPVVSLPIGFLDLDSSPVRKIFSTGDLQGIKPWVQRQFQCGSSSRSESPLASESNSIIEGMSKACRYSPQEKKERIQRYRTKRNLRNFSKKIKYECRKTLADSRPRIRGRFARNDNEDEEEEEDETSSCEKNGTTTPHQSEWNLILQAAAGSLEAELDTIIDDETWINLQLFDNDNFNCPQI
ncbi:unnamed protein product [Cuscuta epithymum]|uniref:CCT domain-containing protein n=1 Tax=Cuscuta epithymum TaxID=186058 RepID=A0AAV0F440_9ASTE|nr:unnamed protein product [Cuscuta epithymum]